jgi:hypothetical protein
MTMMAIARIGMVSVLALSVGCGPRVIIVTGTTIGLKANPGDPEGGRSPQVTLGYKRAEGAIVATKGDGATGDKAPKPGQDAYSTFASVGFKTTWFSDTELTTFIASGFAARGLTAPDSDASDAAGVPKGVVPRAAAGTGNSFFQTLTETAGKVAGQ